MLSNLLETLEALQNKTKTYSELSACVSTVEAHLAGMALAGELEDFPDVVEQQMFIPALKTIKSIQMEQYPLCPGTLKMVSDILKMAQRKKYSAAVSAELLNLYGVNEEFIDFVKRDAEILASSIESQQPLTKLTLPKDWSFHKLTLARRCIIAGLANAWNKDNCDEPILWKISDILSDFYGSSPFLVAELFFVVALEASVHERALKSELDSFFTGLNDDKSGAILDNLVLSQTTYQSLLDEGWQPDRWEIENLPMSISMFLDFISKEDFAQVGQIGDVLDLRLADATENYRYRGSPFSSSNDIKKVKVAAPGWQHHKELIIRPKVVEVSTKGE